MDDSLLIEKESLLFLKKSPDAYFWDEVELRVNIDRFEADQQEFAVRFKTRSWSEMRSEEQFNDVSLESHKARYGLLLNRVLKNRYYTVIEYLYTQEMISVHQDLAKVYEDRLSVLQKSTEISDMDPLKFSYDLVDTENELLRVQMETNRLTSRMKLISNEICRDIGTNCSVSFDKEERVSTDQILKIIEQIAVEPAVKNADLWNAEKDSELAAVRYNLEKSKNSPWFSFIETSYDMENKDDFAKAFSIEFGISVPFGPGSRQKMRRRQLEKIKAKTAFEILKRQHKEDISRVSQELRGLIEQYENFLQKKESGRNRFLYDLWQEREGTDPMILLNLRESMLKSQRAETKLIFKINGIYIDLLDISGKLSEVPLRNYLSQAREYYELCQ